MRTDPSKLVPPTREDFVALCKSASEKTQRNELNDAINDINSAITIGLPVANPVVIIKLYLNRGALHLTLCDLEKANHDLSLALFKFKILSHHPMAPTEKQTVLLTLIPHQILVYSAMTKFISGDCNAAMEMCTQAMNLNDFTDDKPSLGTQDIALHGTIYLSQGKLDLAENDFQFVLKHEPQNANVLLECGYLQLHRNQYDVAQHYFEQAKTTYTENRNDHSYSLAFFESTISQGMTLCQIKQNKYPSQEAIAQTWKEIFSKAESSLINLEGSHFHIRRARVYRAWKEFDLARQALDDCLKVNPNYRIASKLKAQLPVPAFSMQMFSGSATSNQNTSEESPQKKQKTDSANNNASSIIPTTF